MGLHLRNLLPVLFKTQAEISLNVSLDSCLQYCKKYGECHPLCVDYCSAGCPGDLSVSKTKKLFVAVILVTSIAFFLASCYIVYVKYFKRSTSRRPPQEEQRFETHDQFIDEDHGPVIDHPIWHIRTTGLQPSVISSIKVCKYKRGDGLVEGTDCAVCLSEFEEYETLRLLPKCSHAFHVPCVDTWLRSHTNCPVCRAPVVTNASTAAPSQATIANGSSEEENRIAVLENIQESDEEIESEVGEIRISIHEEGESSWKGGDELNQEEDGMHPMRRSVSLDSLSALKISQALPHVLPMESDGNAADTRRPVKESGPNMGIVPNRVSGNQSLLKFMASSSFGRSLQVGPSSLKRSFSCGAKLLLSRYNRKWSQSSDLPS